MKNTITNQLRKMGYTEKQIKRMNNLLNYRSSSFNSIKFVAYVVNTDIIRFYEKDGMILEFTNKFAKGE